MSMRNRVRGVTTVEFAIVGTIFFMALFGVIEFGRALYTLNTLSEVARRGARVAAVCPVNHGAIARVALFNAPGETGPSRFVYGLEEENIEIRYLSDRGEVIADPTANYSDIRFVRVAITGYQFTSLIPFIGLGNVFQTPGFAATLPRESLGVPREGENAVCFGTQT